MKRIAIVTEGDVQMGMGHVTRSLALAEQLRAHGTVIFATHSPPEVQRKIEAQGFQVMVDMSYETCLQSCIPDVVVVDKLNVEEELARYIRHELGCRLAIVGNISPANQYANLVINAVIGAGLKNVRRRDGVTGTLYLEGPAYIVLREEFYQRQGLYKHRSELTNVLLLFGGADPANLTCATLGRLLGDKKIKKITACLGVMNPHGDKIKDLLASSSARANTIDILYDTDTVSQMLLEHDIVLTSFGITLFEAFSLEVPALAFFQNVLQQTMAMDFPMTYDYKKIIDLCAFIRQQHKTYSSYLNLIRPLQSGTGVNEIVDMIVG